MFDAVLLHEGVDSGQSFGVVLAQGRHGTSLLGRTEGQTQEVAARYGPDVQPIGGAHRTPKIALLPAPGSVSGATLPGGR